MIRPLCLAAGLALGVAGSALAQDGVYVLTHMDGRPVDVAFDMIASVEGRLSGQGPCNRWSVSQTADWPFVTLGAIQSTRMTCPDIVTETAILRHLPGMQRAEVDLYGALHLIGPDGARLSFTLTPHAD
jgi:heat shock protein HslJ